MIAQPAQLVGGLDTQHTWTAPRDVARVDAVGVARVVRAPRSDRAMVLELRTC